jgi:hypothetical protein
MKALSQILLETKNKIEYFHATSNDKIDTEVKHPIWLSHNQHQALGWHRLVPGSKTFKVELHSGTKIAHRNDPKVKQYLEKHGVDVNDYEADMTSNPESHEVHNHPGTIALKKAGYHGFTHIDYDPNDNSKDHDSTLLFDRSRIKSQKRHL